MACIALLLVFFRLAPGQGDPLGEGLRALQAGNYGAAIEAFRAVLSAEPENQVVRLHLASALREFGRPSEALDELQRIAPPIEQPLRHLLLQGQVYLDLERFEEAERALREAAQLEPKAARVHYQLGETLASSGRTTEAIESLERAASLQPGWVQPHKRIGELQLTVGLREEAVRRLERAAELAPGAPLVLVSLGEAYRANGQHQKAKEAYEKALAARPDMARVRAELANTLLALGERDDALRELRQAVAAAPEERSFRVALVLLLHGEEMWDEARSELRRLLEEDPRDGLALYYLGDVLLRTGNPEEARESLERAIDALEESPGGPRVPSGRAGYTYPMRIAARVKLAELLLEASEMTAAVELLEAVVQEEPDHATAHYELGLAYRSLGRREDAARTLERFQQLNDAREQDQLALQTIDEGDLDRAREALGEALRIDPQDAVAYWLLGRIAIQEGNREEAVTHLENAVRARPSLQEAYPELARLYCLSGDAESVSKLEETARAQGIDIKGACVPR